MDMPRRTGRPASTWVLIVLAAIQAASGIGGGLGLSLDPINNIGMPLSTLEGSPFEDFLIPGLILLIILGLFPLLVLYGLLRRRQWGWWLAITLGCGLLIWILAEVLLLGYLPGAGLALQITFGLVGALILVFTFVRTTRVYYGVSRMQVSERD